MFKLVKIELGRINVPEPEYLEASVAVSAGMALVLTSGKLAKCGATAKPTYVALGAGTIGETVAVGRVRPDNLYDVPVTAAPTSLKAGAKVTLNTDALQVTVTTTDGVATVVDTLGATAAGDTIRVRFE